jgi:hypothetical protein
MNGSDLQTIRLPSTLVSTNWYGHGGARGVPILLVRSRSYVKPAQFPNASPLHDEPTQTHGGALFGHQHHRFQCSCFEIL